MALDKNDGIFLPSIEGVVSGKTSQVDGMNGIMNNLIGNDNYLKDKKLDRGNYVGSGELLSKDDNGIWGGEYGGNIQDPIPKELNKRYIDNINGKAFICIKAGDSSVVSNTIEYFTPCNVVDNLVKLQNLPKIKSLTIDIPSGALDSSKKREQKTFNISTLNIEPICVFPYVPSSSSEAGGVYLEHVNIVSFNNNTITVDFDYGGQYAIAIEAKAIILYYE